jgi:hypothetical protein
MTISQMDEAMVIRMYGMTPTPPNTQGMDGILPDGRTVEIKSWSGERPRLGKMKIGESVKEALDRLLRADLYALVAVDDKGKYIAWFTKETMRTFCLNTIKISRESSSRGGTPVARFSRKPIR